MSSELKRISIGVDMNAARMPSVEQAAAAGGNRFIRAVTRGSARVPVVAGERTGPRSALGADAVGRTERAS
jgi:hypothetical protein